MTTAQEVAAAAVTRSHVGVWARRLLVPATASAAATLIASARFGLKAPSLVDEWFGVAYGGRAFHAFLHGNYVSGGWDFQGRFRPGYTAVWNYAQWHLLGSPSMSTSMAWGMIRIGAFFTAIWILTRWLSGRDMSAPASAILLAPLAVVFTPSIAVDLARFGPGEPMMIAGVVIGLAAMHQAMQRIVSQQVNRFQLVASAAAFAVGYGIYLLGVYSKECSAGLLLFVPFFVKWAAPRLRDVARRSRRSATALAIAGVLTVAPVLHVAVRLVVAALSGASPWPNAEDMSTGRKIVSAAVTPALGVPGVLRTWEWFFASLFAMGGTILMFRKRERDAWLLAGVLLTGFVVSAIPLARGPTPTWYYIPAVVGIAAVAFRVVAAKSPLAAASAALCVLALVPLGTRSALADWSRAQRSGGEAIDLAQGLTAAHCTTYLSGFDIEHRLAIPLLFRFAQPRTFAKCAATSREAYVISWERKPLPMSLSTRCATEWDHVPTATGVALYGCRSFKPFQSLDQYQASGEPRTRVVELRVRPRDPLPRDLFQPLANRYSG